MGRWKAPKIPMFFFTKKLQEKLICLFFSQECLFQEIFPRGFMVVFIFKQYVYLTFQFMWILPPENRNIADP